MNAEDPQPRPVAGERLAAWRHVPVLAAGAAIVLLGWLAYRGSFRGKFFFDDHRNILENRTVTRLRPLRESLPRLLRADMRPTTLLSLAINYHICRDRPRGYHAFNLAVHVVAALLLFGIVRRTLLCDRLRDRFRRAAVPLAAAVAAVWMVHPLQTQAITYIVQRYESLMGMFYLLTMYCAVRSLAPAPGRRLWSGAAIAACALGMGAKQVMVTAPLMVVVYDAAVGPRPFLGTLRRRWWLYAALGGTWVILALLIRFGPVSRSAGFGYRHTLPGQYAMTQFGVILRYLRLSFWPVGLCLDYGWPTARTAGEILPPAIAVAALLSLTGWALWRCPAWGLAGAWFFLVLAPSSSIMPVADAAVEHRTYLPLAGVVAAVVMAVYVGGGWLAGRVGPRRAVGKALAVAGAVLAVAVLAVLTWLTDRRNADYHSEVGMWSDVVKKSPHWYRGYDSLGVALSREKRYPEAIQAHRKALELNPAHTEGYYNLGVALANDGQTDRAIRSFHQAIRRRPRHIKAHCNLGNAYVKLGNLKEGEKWCRKALRLNPKYVIGHGALGAALEEQGRLDEAEAQYRKVLQLQPGNQTASRSLVGVLLKAGKKDQALAFCRQWLKERPGNLDARRSLVDVLLKAGKMDQAVDFCRQWLKERPGNPDARLKLAEALESRGDIAGCIREFRALLADHPDHAVAANNLAWRLATCPREDIRDGARAVELARIACEKTDFESPIFIDTLAAACAEAGQFDQAVRRQRQALDVIRRLGHKKLSARRQEETIREYESRLRLYESGRPYRTASP